jgi:tetratricopeptide (TPR) repeat protein
LKALNEIEDTVTHSTASLDENLSSSSATQPLSSGSLPQDDPLSVLDEPLPQEIVKKKVFSLLSDSSLFFTGLMGSAGLLLLLTFAVKFIYVPTQKQPNHTFVTASNQTQKSNVQLNTLSVPSENNTLSQNSALTTNTPSIAPTQQAQTQPQKQSAKSKNGKNAQQDIVQKAPTLDPTIEKATGQLEKARMIFNQGDVNGAVQQAIQAYEVLKPLQAQKEAQTAQISLFDLLAQSWEKMNKQADAVAAQERSLKIASAYYGDTHPEVAYRYERLSHLYDLIHQANLAVMSKERALIIAENDPLVNKDSLAMNFNNLGESYRSQKDFSRAETAFRKAVKIMEGLHGATAAEIAIPLNNLGMTAFYTGNYTDAETYLRRSLDILVQKEGRKSASAEKVMDNLKTLLEQQGRRREADDLIRRYFL